MDEEKPGRIERLKQALYRRGVSPRTFKRFELHPHETVGRESWSEPQTTAEAHPPKIPMPFWKKFLIFSVIFFAAAAGISLFVFLGGANTVSTRNVDIAVSGPVAVSAGEKIELQLLIQNNNAVALESADLLIEYPEGAVNPANFNQKLTRLRKSLGSISPGAVFKEPVPVVLFGQEGDEKKFSFSLEYRVADSNAIFVKEKEYGARVSSSATTLSLVTLSEVVSGQEFELRATITSNTDTVTKNLALEIEYPFGFVFRSADPRPVNEKNVWTVGDLPPRGTRTVAIRGSLDGQDGEKKVFRASLGEYVAAETEVGVIYNTSLSEISIARPFLSVVLFINGSAVPEYIAGPEETVDVSAVWTNTLPTRIIDAKIEVGLTGDVIDKASVDPRNGFYDSRTNTITWDKNSLPELAAIDSGVEGRVNFRFSFLPLLGTTGSSFKNPSVSIAITTSGNRLSQAGALEEVSNSVERKIKVTSEAIFTPRIVYFSGPFQNTGPLPPVIEQETTYTVLWSAINSANHISRASVKAVLPPYVRWMGVASPGNENVTFNEVSREVIWNIGRLEAGSGISKEPREVAFQVAFLPSVSHVSQTPVVVGESAFTGVDEFTGSEVRLSGKALTISLTTDPNYVFTYGKVIEPKSE